MHSAGSRWLTRAPIRCSVKGSPRRRRPGARATAIGPLREAHGIAQALGAAPLAKEVERLAGRGRLNLGGQPATPPSSPDLVVSLGLTTRELEVLQLVALGRTNRQIAEELFITEKTAGHHVLEHPREAGRRGRTEAAAVAQRLGLALDRSTTADADS